MWREHQDAPYPDGYGGVELAGVELVMLGANIAGCVSTYLHNGGRLDLQRAAILGRCYRDVSLVVRELSGTPRAYFAQLERMAGQVLEALSVGGPAV